MARARVAPSQGVLFDPPQGAQRTFTDPPAHAFPCHVCRATGYRYEYLMKRGEYIRIICTFCVGKGHH